VDGGDSYSTYEIGTDLSLSPYKDTGLVGYWKMDEGMGSTTKDDAASNTGTITGATWKSESDGCPSGNCLYFDGTDYITTPSFALTGTVLTVTGWVKIGNTGNQSIVGDSFALGYSGHLWFYRQSGTDILYWNYADGATPSRVGMSTFFTNYSGIWVYVTIVADYSGAYPVKFYRNGELIQTSNMTTPLFPSDSRIKYVGTYSSTLHRMQDGSLDDIRIYNRGLSDAEIKSLYEGTK
jgi:hypothetical protein